MSHSHGFKIGASCLALSILGACASTPQQTPDGAQAKVAQTLPKPDAETIAGIKNLSPLEQANFWNQHYNAHPTDLDISLSYIDSLFAINSFDRAGEVAKLSTASFPDNPDVFMALGKALNKLDKPLESARAYGRVVEISPDNAAPLAALGAIFDSRGDHETAQLAYHRALAIEPDRPATLSNLGLSLTLVGKLEQAEEVLAKATSLPDATPAIRQNYALILGLLGKFDDARRIAAIDAPEGIAMRNTDFLKSMVGDNPQLQSIAQAAPQQAPAKTTSTPPAPKEVPVAAPTNLVTTAALDDLTPPPNQQSAVATQTKTSPLKGGLRSRKRNRSTSSGGD